ncbi:uncharacterized protein LOC120541482 isoform X2 [Polypterus senegalus]|uniref:uncharacterized protein LOC120541482 isoform X2 n=1 Tax=Polypterus senegalus TaxID=55291 RepID=UPI001964CE98|nr:uncharacterized protein LOC120541482 isoform X2 [Polypterus senegalus]
MVATLFHFSWAFIILCCLETNIVYSRIRLPQDPVTMVPGQNLTLQVNFDPDSSVSRHSISWLLYREKSQSLKIVQYIWNQDLIHVYSAFDKRVNLSRNTGSLTLFNFNETDVGTYGAIVTFEDGTESGANATVKIDMTSWRTTVMDKDMKTLESNYKPEGPWVLLRHRWIILACFIVILTITAMLLCYRQKRKADNHESSSVM